MYGLEELLRINAEADRKEKIKKAAAEERETLKRVARGVKKLLQELGELSHD